jgi:molecular chaperone DnaK (HSP70)
LIVGIDLGTTHSALAYALAGAPVAILSIPQVVAPRSIEARPLLPSFVFFPHESDGKQPLPWDAGRTFVVGERARAEGASQPTRVVSSAKSWLSHRSVDRRAAMLPLSAPDDVDKVSAVEASWRFLEHLAEAYDAHFANGDDAQKLAAQEIVLTVPASFDAAARELTVEAAFAAGLENVTLLEEPQAAVYAWIAARGDRWRTELRPGDVLLVVDVGGGTTDFSAIAVVDDGGSLALSRVAVGDHILLGGDNMDLALAHL